MPGRSASTGGKATRRPWAAAGGLAVALLLGGCATQVAGSPRIGTSASSASSPVASTPATSSQSQTAPGSPAGSPQATSTAATNQASSQASSQASGHAPLTANAHGVDPAAFAARMAAATKDVTSMKGSVSLEAGSAQVSGTFAESIVRGRVSALDMSMFITQSGQNVAMRMLLVNGHFYLGGNAVLAALNVRDKRWALLSQDSANPRLAQLADQLSPYLAAVSGDQYGSYAGAAASIQDVGRQQLGGASARKYLVTVDVAKLARMTTGVSRSAAQRIAASGVRTLPMTLWLADSGRLLQVELSSTANGATSHTRYRVTGYNVAVRIRQPADDDVYTG